MPTTANTTTARCTCGATATNQALYRRTDGSHFLGQPVCDADRYPVGPLAYARGSEIVDHMELVG